MLLKIQGGRVLSGTHAVSGNKNAVLPMIAASLLTSEPVTLTNVPAISDVAAMLENTNARLRAEGYTPYYLYRQKYMSGSFENVGWSRDGLDCLYNIYMMEEIHSIFAVGAGAVSKMVDYRPADGGKPVIERLFYPKYPYEYLKDDSTKEKCETMEKFYREHGML